MTYSELYMTLTTSDLSTKRLCRFACFANLAFINLSRQPQYVFPKHMALEILQASSTSEFRHIKLIIRNHIDYKNNTSCLCRSLIHVCEALTADDHSVLIYALMDIDTESNNIGVSFDWEKGYNNWIATELSPLERALVNM